MYPARDLKALAARKAAQRRHIAAHRGACVLAAARVVEPLAWADRMIGYWRRLAPLASVAAVPLAALLFRRAGPRTGLVATLLRWGPLALHFARGLGGARSR